MPLETPSHKHIAFIICPHGFGHIRRVSEVCNELLQKETLQITIITNKNHFDAYESLLPEWFHQPTTRISFQFDGMDKAPAWTNKDYQWHEYTSWIDHLSEKLDHEKFDLVVSDNLAGMLGKISIILEGSFLWSEVFSTSCNPVLKQISEKEENLLKQHKPEMICLERMAMNGVKQYTNPIYTNWWCDKTSYSKLPGNNLNVLVTGGGTANAEKVLLPLLTALKTNPGINLSTDKRLAPAAGINNEIFSFSDDEFRQLDAIIARPGIGTLTEAIKFNIPLLCFGESDHQELIFNAQRWEEAGFGYNCMNKDPSVIGALLSPGMLNECHQKLLNEPGGGHKQAAAFLLKKLYQDEIKS